MNDGNTDDFSALIPAVVALAREAGRRIMAVYESEFAIEHKDDKSPLTTADLAAHHAIRAGLELLTPQIPLLSEESSKIPYAERSLWPRYWLVDPLDGTREFIKRNGEFTVNIALVQGHHPVLGVVCIPVSGLCYYGALGCGAYKGMPDQPPQPIAVRRMGDGPAVVVGSRSHAGDSLGKFLSRIGNHELISMGSALKLCLVAEGRADIYPRLGPTSEWDTAAAQAVVEAAGGQVTDVAGERLLYNTKDSLLNPFFLVFGDAARDWPKYLV